MLDEVCEAAKQEMRDVKESQLGSWKNAVTVADCTWQTLSKIVISLKESFTLFHCKYKKTFYI